MTERLYSDIKAAVNGQLFIFTGKNSLIVNAKMYSAPWTSCQHFVVSLKKSLFYHFMDLDRN